VIEHVEIPSDGDGDNTESLALVTASGRVISPTEANDIRSMVFQSLGDFIDPHRFELLMQPQPKYAVKHREGGGGSVLPYLKHGYVKLKLTQIFGIDWSHELLPFFAGEPYRLTPGDEAGMPTGNGTVTVYGRLTINIHVARGRGHETTFSIVRTGFGSSEWRKKMELGDVLKSAQSDAFKVAASTLGPALGLTLYWDDENELAKDEKADEAQKELERAWARQQEALKTNSPTNFATLFSRAKSELGLSLNDLAVRLATPIKDLARVIDADPIGVWQKLKQSKADEAAATAAASTTTTQAPIQLTPSDNDRAAQASTPDTQPVVDGSAVNVTITAQSSVDSVDSSAAKS